MLDDLPGSFYINPSSTFHLNNPLGLRSDTTFLGKPFLVTPVPPTLTYAHTHLTQVNPQTPPPYSTGPFFTFIASVILI